MFVSLCALLLTVAFALVAPSSAVFHENVLAWLMAGGGTILLILTLVFNVLALLPLERLEQKLVPNLMELLRRDRRLWAARALLYLFPLLSYFSVALLSILTPVEQKWLFLGWIVAFGIAIDLLRDSWRRLVNFLNPSYLVDQLQRDAKAAVKNIQDKLFWFDLDSLAEIGLRSVENTKMALGIQTLQTFPPIMQTFFDSSKSISRVNQDQSVERATGQDEASYTVYYLLQRLELINDKALQSRLETICRQMIISLGKIIVYSAKYDLTMVSFPTHFLTKFGLKAQQHHFDEVGVLTTSTLLEIARTIVNEVDLTYAELQEPFRAIINGLDALAKATFKKDKNTSIQVLIQPLIDIKSLFETEKMANHPDKPVIVSEINRILEEFQVLEQIMRGIPTIPDLDNPPSSSPEPVAS